MKLKEQMELIEKLPFESRIAFIAFCAERCIKEARLHVFSNKQLDGLPMLLEGLEMLWAIAEGSAQADPERITAILSHLSTYDKTSADHENVDYNYDITLVEAANEVRGGLLTLQKPELAEPRLVVNAVESPHYMVSNIYDDYKKARKDEVSVIDTALLKLVELGDSTFSRDLFDGIPEWDRGKLAKKYAENRLVSTAEDDDE